MEYIPSDRILEVHEDTLDNVRKVHGLDGGQMRVALNELQEWIQQQNHFKKKDFSALIVAQLTSALDCHSRALPGNDPDLKKGSVEGAKSRLEKACSQRTRLPQFFEDHDAKEYFKDYDRKFVNAVLPKLTKDHTRVFAKKWSGDLTSSMISRFYRLMIMLHKIFFALLPFSFKSTVKLAADLMPHPFAEYCKAHDYADGFIMLVDFRELNLMSLVTKINPFELRQAASIIMDGYGTRVKGIHVVSTSIIMNVLVAILRGVLSSKVGGRIKVHKTLESMHEHVSEEILPEEFGGRGGLLARLHDEWMEVFSSPEYRKYQNEMNRAGVNESRRTKPK